MVFFSDSDACVQIWKAPRFSVSILAMVSTPEKNIDKCLEAQVEEIEVINSIYGNDWKTEHESDRSYSIEIKEGDTSVTLYVTLPSAYPFESPPSFTISAPGLRRDYKRHLSNLLEEVYLQNVGQTVLFQWINKIKEYLSTLVYEPENLDDSPKDSQLEESCEPESLIPEVVHGEVIVDRKSTFQGHAAYVTSVNEVRNVISELKKIKKIANATHNMFAYRINHKNGTYIQDCEDDGETHAGGRLLHLLQILDVSNVMVVVSRWYGGICLGSTRFCHVNNAARQALEQAGIITSKKKT